MAGCIIHATISYLPCILLHRSTQSACILMEQRFQLEDRVWLQAGVLHGVRWNNSHFPDTPRETLLELSNELRSDAYWSDALPVTTIDLVYWLGAFPVTTIDL